MRESQERYWLKSTIGTLATKLVNGGTPPTDIERFWSGKIPWITGADFDNAGIRNFRRFVSEEAITGTATNVIHEGELLIVTRTGVGKLAIAPCDVAISQDITGLYVDKSQVMPGFLYYRLKLGVEDLKKLNQGTSINGIIREDLIRYELNLPPLSEQRRIAEILSTVDETIQQTEALIAKYQQIKTGLMHDLFTRGLTPDGRLRPTRAQAPHLYKQSPLGWIPNEWNPEPICQLGSVHLGRQRSPGQLSGRWTTPYLRVANVFNGRIDYSDVLEMDFNPEERQRFSVKNGDILLNEGQSLELVGRCALYEGLDDQYCFQNTLVRFRVHERQHPRFYQALFAWFLDCGVFIKIAKQTTSVAHLGADRFARMLCPHVPFDEQLRITEKLNQLEGRLSLEKAIQQKRKHLKSALMQDLLTGRVRVPIPELTTA